MKRSLLLLIFLLTLSHLFAQYQSDTIVIKDAARGIYKQNGRYLLPKQFEKLLQSDPDAFQMLKKAQSNLSTANTLGFIGGGCIGYPLGTLIAGGKPNWVLAGVGGVLIWIAIPLYATHTVQIIKAVKIYNNGLQTTMRTVGFNLNLSSNGIGIKMNF